MKNFAGSVKKKQSLCDLNERKKERERKRGVKEDYYYYYNRVYDTSIN